MATTAVLYANDTHKTEQSPQSFNTSSPIVHGYSPNETSVYNVTGVSPTEGTTPVTYSNSNFQPAYYPLQPTRDSFQDLTPEPPAEECSSQVQVCSTNFVGTSSMMSNDDSEVTVICDPFYEPPLRGRHPSTAPPPIYPNMGDPRCSGIRLELPRIVKFPYPESAHEALPRLNKLFGTVQASAPMYVTPRGRSMPYASVVSRNAYPGNMNLCGVSPSYPAPTPSPSGMSPSYMQQVRSAGYPKLCNSQMPGPYGFSNVPYGANNVVRNTKKTASSAAARRKQNAKAAAEERAAKAMARMEFSAASGHTYGQMCDIGRPSTSAANNFGLMPAVMSRNPVMGSHLLSAPCPPNLQSVMYGARSHYSYDNSVMGNNNPNMQHYQSMQPMNNQDCSGLMQPPPLPMRVSGHMSNMKPELDMNQLQKASMYQQSPGLNSEMQPDGIRMFDGRSMDKNSQYQVQYMPSAHNKRYGGLRDSMSNSSVFSQSGPVVQRCGLCRDEIKDGANIQCTGNGQGCLRYFHQACSQMMVESFEAILNEPCAEWICNECDRQRQLLYS